MRRTFGLGTFGPGRGGQAVAAHSAASAAQLTALEPRLKNWRRVSERM